MSVNLENIELIDKSATQYIRDHRDPNKSYSGHDEPHLRSVAQLSTLACLAAGYDSKDIELSRIAGWFHDFERSMNETNATSDEAKSAEASTDFSIHMHSAGLYSTTDGERKALEDSILKNGRPPEFFRDRPLPEQWTQQEKVLAALFVADKMEQNGVWVIARRSQFVGGARLRADGADLPKYGLQPNRDENTAVLLEGLVRIAFINPEGIYPPVFKPLTSRMYDPQRDFLHGLFAAAGMNLDGGARLLLETKLIEDPNHPNYLQTRNLPVLSRADLAKRLHLIGGLSDEKIQAVNGDLARSAIEAVAYFSSQYKKSLEELVQTWTPQNHTAKQWQTDMMEYISGKWFNKITTELTQKTI